MSKNIKGLIIALLFLVSILNYRVSYGYKKLDLIELMIENSNASISEIGIKTHFELHENGQELYNTFLDEINQKYEIYNNHIAKDETNFLIEFKNKDSKGYIEFNTNEGKQNVSIQVIERNGNKSLESLQNEFNNMINLKRDGDVQWYRYVKAKLNKKDSLIDVNNNIVNFMQQQGAKDIDTIEIENGYSSSAYTGRYEYIKSGTKLIDINFAVCKYSSGNYVVIGTPEIFTSY